MKYLKQHNSRFMGMLGIVFLFLAFTVSTAQEEVIQLWLPEGSVDVDLLTQQLGKFIDETNIAVEVSQLNAAEYFQMLLTAFESGEKTSDIVLLSRGDAAYLANIGFLLPISNLATEVGINIEDFTAEALSNITFSDDQYGLPFRRFGCSPRYMNFGISATTELATDSLLVIDFLTQSEQQIENYEVLNWGPTRTSAYDQLSLDCAQVVPLYPTPEQIVIAQMIAAQLQDTLADVLEEHTLNIALATLYDSTASEPDIESQTLIAAAPVTDIYTEEMLFNLLPEGVILGAMRIAPESEYAINIGASGDFVVKCYGEDGLVQRCDLIDLTESVFNLTGIEEEAMPLEVGPTTVFFVEGSIKICWWSDSRQYCWTLF
jgi:hypothetical protein